MTLVTSTTARGSLLYKTEQHHSFLRGRKKKKPKEEVKEGKNNQKPKKKKKLRTFLQKLHKNLLRILSRRRLRSLFLSQISIFFLRIVVRAIVGAVLCVFFRSCRRAASRGPTTKS